MMNLKLYIAIALVAVLTTSCSEFALLASGASIAGSQNAYAKAYSGVDMLTIIKTEKDIKKHIYEQLRDKTTAK